MRPGCGFNLIVAVQQNKCDRFLVEKETTVLGFGLVPRG
jgi:hypothetical protein